VSPSQARRTRRIARVRQRMATRDSARVMDEARGRVVRTVLVVDDDDDIRFFHSEVLRRQGYNVIEASCAAEAERAALDNVPALILMDIAMPGLDGLSEVWRLREHPQVVNVPVVIVSAYDAYDLRAESAAQGCRGYLTKPVEPEGLTSLVDEILQGECCGMNPPERPLTKP
jgi:CheY-like chemotaxis protein